MNLLSGLDDHVLMMLLVSQQVINSCSEVLLDGESFHYILMILMRTFKINWMYECIVQSMITNMHLKFSTSIKNGIDQSNYSIKNCV